MFQAYLGTDPMTGKPVRVTRRKDENGRPFPTKKSAQQEAARLVEVFNNSKGSVEKKKITFDEVYEMWLKKVYKKSVTDSTYINITRRVERYVLPYFSRRLIHKIDKRYCDDIVHKWLDSDFKDYKRLVGVVKRIFDYAVYIEVTKHNPMDMVYLPTVKREKKREIEFFERDELIIFLDEAYKHGFKWGTLFQLIAYSGCRKGEALALEWKDINWRKKTVRINKTLTKRGSGVVLRNTTKNGEERTVALDDFTLNKLKQWRKKSVKNNVMFPSESQGYLYPDTVNTTMKRILKKMNTDKYVTPHGLRHTHCSLLFAAGLNIKDVQKRLGHKSTKVTMDIYTHVTKDKEQEAAEVFLTFMQK